jgi:hypothetical protein
MFLLIFGYTISGWIDFLLNVFPHITLNGEMLGIGILTVFVLAVGVHFFMAWFYENYGNPTGEAAASAKRQWRLRWSLTGLAIFILMFVTSIAMTGFMHQVAWLTNEPIVVDTTSRLLIMPSDPKGPVLEYGAADLGLDTDWDTAITIDSMNKICIALAHYQAEHGSFPKTVGTVSLQEAGISLESDLYEDIFGTPLKYTSDGQSYTLRSYGPNGILGESIKSDDIVLLMRLDDLPSLDELPVRGCQGNWIQK